MARCPKCGEASTDADYCSECGAAMTAGTGGAIGASAAPSAAPDAVHTTPAADAAGAAAVQLCPVCGEARPGPLARYCDTCRYDFVTATPFSTQPPPGTVAGEASASASPAASGDVSPRPASAAPQAIAPAPAPSPDTRLRWELLAQVDETLRKPEDPVPTDHSERLFSLDHGDHLIGRRSDGAGIHPEIVIPDPGISRRHARLLRRPDGGLALVDLGSMNGTRLNGAPVEPNVIVTLAEGDEVTLGCWTRLKLRAT